ncbi:putative Ulp1 protease family catalytic domain, papain-like cysteine peptidase superfamily [Helianthus anomalus]
MDEAERLDVIATSIKELLKGSEDKPNLKAFRVVLIPIAENGHYYLICFDLKNPAIEVIDNIHETKSFVGLQDNDDYNKKDTVLKVKHMFVAYLKAMHNAKWKEMKTVEPKKLKMTWQTKKNSIDCGVFVMRHMEAYKESGVKNWECGFKTEKSNKQDAQISLLRQKYAAKILLSKANLHRDSVIQKTS